MPQVDGGTKDPLMPGTILMKQHSWQIHYKLCHVEKTRAEYLDDLDHVMSDYFINQLF